MDNMKKRHFYKSGYTAAEKVSNTDYGEAQTQHATRRRLSQMVNGGMY